MHSFIHCVFYSVGAVFFLMIVLVIVYLCYIGSQNEYEMNKFRVDYLLIIPSLPNFGC